MRIETTGNQLRVVRDPADKYPRERDWWNAVNNRLASRYEVRTPGTDLCPRPPQTYLKGKRDRVVRVNTGTLSDEWAGGHVLLVIE